MSRTIEQREISMDKLSNLCVEYKTKFSEKSKMVPAYSVNDDKTVSIPLYYYYHMLDKKKAIGACGHERSLSLNQSFKLRPYQSKEDERCMKLLKEKGTLFLNVRCAWGKTAMGLHLLSKLGGRCMIMHDNSVIETGWVNSIRKYSPSTSFKFIESSVNYSDDRDTTLFIASVNTLSNMKREFMPRNLNSVFVDEAKCFCTELRIKQLLKCECNYLIGASADIERSDNMHNALYMFYGPRDSFVYSEWQGDFDYVLFNTNIVPDMKFNTVGYGINAKKVLDWNNLLRSISNSDSFNSLIVNTALLFSKNKILVLTKFKRQLNVLYKMMIDRGVDAVRLTGKASTHRDADVVIATIKKAYKGYDVANASESWDGRNFEVIISATDIGTEIVQSFGRGFRHSHPIIVDFCHNMTRLRQHQGERQNWCVERGASVHKFSVSIE